MDISHLRLSALQALEANARGLITNHELAEDLVSLGSEFIQEEGREPNTGQPQAGR